MSTSIVDYIFRVLAIEYLGRYELAQAGQSDLHHDTIGKPRTERFGPASSIAAGDPVRAPSPNGPSAGGASREAGFEEGDAVGGPSAGPTSAAIGSEAPVRPVASLMTERDEARLKGYEGDACWNCGQLTLVRNGTCLKCVTCGETSGCS